MLFIAVSVSVMAAKAAVAIITDKRIRNAVLSVIVGVIAVIAFLIMMTAGVLTAASNLSEAYLTALFSEDGLAPPGLGPEETAAFDRLKLAFSLLYKEVSAQNEGLDEEQRIDAVRVKSVFLSLWPRGDYPDLTGDFLPAFVSCFAEEDPYPSIETLIGRAVDDTERTYADSVYRYISYGEKTLLIDVSPSVSGRD